MAVKYCKGWLNGVISRHTTFDLMPVHLYLGAMAQIKTVLVVSIKGLKLPIGTDAIVMPQLQILGPVNIFQE
jgi:hypothetical protein